MNLTPLTEKEAKMISDNLHLAWKDNSSGLKRLFETRKCFVGEFAADYKPFLDVGLLARVNGHLTTDFALVYVDGFWIFCDRPTNPRIDRVFPVFDDESLLLARSMPSHLGGKVLDIGTGSGAIAIYAAKAGNRVLATDISQRAAAIAQFNFAINGFSDLVRYRHSDVYQSLAAKKFDLIVSNPPFVPHPKGFHLFLHSDGGADGLAIVRRLLQQAKSFLNPNGELRFVVLSLGNNEGWLIERELRAWRDADAFTVQIQNIYREPSISLDEFAERFTAASDYNDWRQKLIRRSYDRVGYFLVRAVMNGAPQLQWLPGDTKQKFDDTTFWGDNYSGSMSNRLKRYIQGS